MSLKISQQNHNYSHPNNKAYFNSNSQSQDLLIDQIQRSPQAKRFLFDTEFNPNHYNQEINLPSELDKLKKLFPLLDDNHLANVLSECNLKCGKAYEKIISQKIEKEKEEQQLKSASLQHKRVIIQNQNRSANFSSINQNSKMMVSKKRGRRDVNENLERGQNVDQNFIQSENVDDNFQMSMNNNQSQHLLNQQFQDQNQISQQQQQQYQQHQNSQNNSLMCSPQQQVFINQYQSESQNSNQQSKNLEEVIAESTTERLMSCGDKQQALQILTQAFKQYKDESLKKDSDIVKSAFVKLYRQYQILKISVQTQNEKSKDAIDKSAMFDQMYEAYQNQCCQIEQLKEELTFWRKKAITSGINNIHGSMSRDYNHNGDPSVL